MRQYHALLLTFSIFSLMGWGLLLFTQVNLNVSGSLSHQVFFCVKRVSFKCGDFVCIAGHHTLYSGDLPLTKQMMGFPGEGLAIKGGCMFVGGKCVGKLCDQTQDGKLLTPLKARVIPEGYLFVSGDHPRSFDSRYEEFGLVKESCIQGKCWGLGKRKEQAS